MLFIRKIIRFLRIFFWTFPITKSQRRRPEIEETAKTVQERENLIRGVWGTKGPNRGRSPFFLRRERPSEYVEGQNGLHWPFHERISLFSFLFRSRPTSILDNNWRWSQGSAVFLSFFGTHGNNTYTCEYPLPETRTFPSELPSTYGLRRLCPFLPGTFLSRIWRGSLSDNYSLLSRDCDI